MGVGVPKAMQRTVMESPSLRPSLGCTAGDSAKAGTMGSVQAMIVSDGSLVCKLKLIVNTVF